MLRCNIFTLVTQFKKIREQTLPDVTNSKLESPFHDRRIGVEDGRSKEQLMKSKPGTTFAIWIYRAYLGGLAFFGIDGIIPYVSNTVRMLISLAKAFAMRTSPISQISQEI